MRAPARVTVEERLTRKTGLSPPAESVRFTLMLSKLFGVIQQQGLEAHFSLRAIPPLTEVAAGLQEAFPARCSPAWPSQARP